MTLPCNTQQLLDIEEAHDVYCDGFLSDDGRLVFMSIWGRDTALQELLGRFSLKPADGGLRGLHVGPQYIDMSHADALEKDSGRLPKSSLLGAIAHLWIYDPIVRAPDRVNRRAVMLVNGEVDDVRVWSLVKELCHLPLLDEWQTPVLAEFRDNGWVTSLRGHAINGIKVDLSAAEIETFVSHALRQGRLVIPEAPASTRRKETCV